ncbi:MAG: Nif3-like dinuclear metal center hexameric protein [Bacteroidota bacterium]|nr:Nif3-like dinuclear metal center hexameric protein [Bacteroidota bacterium]
MTVKEFQNKFEPFVPPAIAWKGDNVGLQIGRGTDTIRAVLVALDATLYVAKEAVKKKTNLIITHHPLLFHPVQNLTSDTRVGEIAQFITEKKINLYSAHTNLDSVQWGVNFVLAKALGLTDVQILSPLKDSFTKIVVFVPKNFIETVATAMHNAGAGMFTKYDHCSFRGEGTGTFRGMNNARPFLGEVGKLERAEEIRLEMVCESWKIKDVLSAMRVAHPYEEIAYDVYPLMNENTEYGLGAIGNLPKAVSENNFLSLVKKKLKTPSLRYSAGKGARIKRVAVCGGSGSEYINDAIHQGADAMVTADLKYHTFQDVEHKILLVDAGHYETEHLVLGPLAMKIREILQQRKHSIPVFITETTTNPIRYY